LLPPKLSAIGPNSGPPLLFEDIPFLLSLLLPEELALLSLARLSSLFIVSWQFIYQLLTTLQGPVK